MKAKQRSVTVCLLALSLLMSGCGPGQIFGPTFTPTPTITPTPTLTPTPTPTFTSTPTITPTPTPNYEVITIQNFQRLQAITEFDCPAGYCRGISFLPCSSLIALSVQKGEYTHQDLAIYDPSNGKLVFEAQSMGLAYNGKFTPDGRYFVYPDLTRNVLFYNLETEHTDRSFQQPTNDPEFPHNLEVALSPDGKLMAVMDNHGAITYVWDIEKEEMLYTLDPKGDGGYIEFMPDGKTLIIGRYNTSLYDTPYPGLLFVNGITGKIESSFSSFMKREGYLFSISADGSLIAMDKVIGIQEVIQIGDLIKGNIIKTIEAVPGNNFSIASFAFSQNNDLLFIGLHEWVHQGENWATDPRSLQIWNLSNGEHLKTFDMTGNGFGHLFISDDGKFIAWVGHKKITIFAAPPP